MFTVVRDLDTGKFLAIGMFDGKIGWGDKEDHLAFATPKNAVDYMEKHFPKVRYELINI